MTEKLKIKVIKKNAIKAAAAPVKDDSRTKREVAREMVSTVSTWVNDFQARKREETRIAFETLLKAQKPQAAGS